MSPFSLPFISSIPPEQVTYVRDPAEVKKHKAHEEHLKRKNRQAISAAEEG